VTREFIVVAALAVGLSACGGVDVRYTPTEAAVPLPRERMMQIASIGFKDASGGVRTEGASVSLKRPFFDIFREAAKGRLDALKIQLAKRGGTVVDIELTKVDIKGSAGDVTATVAYAVVVRGGLDAVCRQESSVWAASRTGLAVSPAADALQKALVKAVDRLGATIGDSCLYTPLTPAPVAAPVVRDPKALAIIVGVERYREGIPSANFAESDARAVALSVKSVLGAADDRILLLLGAQASLADFQKYFERWLPAHASADAKVIVYFAGNGAPEGKTGAGYLLPYDADLNFLEETAFPLERLYAALGRLPGGATVVLDACFSGANGRSALPAGMKPRGDESAARLPAGVTVISAASPGQACGLDKDGGLFTRFFVQGLKEREGNMKAAFDFLEPEVKKAARTVLKADQDPRWSQGL
jgi:hypothetical protein